MKEHNWKGTSLKTSTLEIGEMQGRKAPYKWSFILRNEKLEGGGWRIWRKGEQEGGELQGWRDWKQLETLLKYYLPLLTSQNVWDSKWWLLNGGGHLVLNAN